MMILFIGILFLSAQKSEKIKFKMFSVTQSKFTKDELTDLEFEYILNGKKYKEVRPQRIIRKYYEINEKLIHNKYADVWIKEVIYNLPKKGFIMVELKIFDDWTWWSKVDVYNYVDNVFFTVFLKPGYMPMLSKNYKYLVITSFSMRDGYELTYYDISKDSNKAIKELFVSHKEYAKLNLQNIKEF